MFGSAAGEVLGQRPAHVPDAHLIGSQSEIHDVRPFSDSSRNSPSSMAAYASTTSRTEAGSIVHGRPAALAMSRPWSSCSPRQTATRSVSGRRRPPCQTTISSPRRRAVAWSTRSTASSTSRGEGAGIGFGDVGDPGGVFGGENLRGEACDRRRHPRGDVTAQDRARDEVHPRLTNGPVRARNSYLDVGNGTQEVGSSAPGPRQGSAGFGEADPVRFIHLRQGAPPFVRAACAALAALVTGPTPGATLRRATRAERAMADEAGESRIEFRLLGVFQVASGGRMLEIGSPKQRRLLALLVVNLNRPVPVDVIVETLWSNQPPASAQSTLQSLVSRLASNSAPARPVVPSCGTATPAMSSRRIRARSTPARFDDLTRRGHAAVAGRDPATAAEFFAEALGLWRGPALADLADAEPFRPEAARLDEARLGVVEDLAEAELELGAPAQALSRLEPHVATNPLRERAWGQRMLALYRLGRQADALRAYQTLRRVLAEELGLEPTPALRRLEQQILLQSPELDAPPPEAPSSPREAAETETFLFTDIEASTRRWEGDQDAMARDLGRHDELLRHAVESRRRPRLQSHGRRALRGVPHRLGGTRRSSRRTAGTPHDGVGRSCSAARPHGRPRRGRRTGWGHVPGTRTQPHRPAPGPGRRRAGAVLPGRIGARPGPAAPRNDPPRPGRTPPGRPLPSRAGLPATPSRPPDELPTAPLARDPPPQPADVAQLVHR